MISRTQVLFTLHILACFTLVCGCLAGSLLPCAVAHAEGTPASPDQYKQLIDQALLEFRHQNWPESRALFRRAHALTPSARTLRGMGVVSYEMRDYVQAARDLSAALVDARQPLNAEQRSEAETLLARAKTFVGVYSVSLEPASAELLLDGVPAELEPDGTLLLAFGEHEIEATASGYERARTQLSVQGGERGELTLALVPAFVESDALVRAEVPAPAQTKKLDRPEPSSPSPVADTSGGLRYTWLALGAGAVFGGAAAASWFLGAQKLKDLDAACADSAQRGMPCRSGVTDTQQIERYQLATNVALGLSGAAVVAAGVLAIVEWPRSTEHQVALGVGPSFVSVRGAF